MKGKKEMEMKRRFYKKEDIERANDVSLIQVAEKLGYHVRGNGRYAFIAEMDSLRIFNDRTWYRFSKKTCTGLIGGNAVKFLRETAGMNFNEAVRWLLEFQGREEEDQAERTMKRKPFVLPERSGTNDILMHYLHDIRGITEETIGEMMQLGILYESYPKHDLVFVGFDKNGEARYAALHGTGTGSFKKDVPGSEKEYGVHVDRSNAGSVIVTEAAIDLMSCLDLDTDRVNILALGGLHDSPLERYLKEHDDVQNIVFALDNDGPGKDAFRRLAEKYRQLGFRVSGYPIPEEYKDLNEYLLGIRRGNK